MHNCTNFSHAAHGKQSHIFDTLKENVDCTGVLCFIKDKYKGKMIMNTITSSK